MPIPSLFPDYLQGENRVTLALLAVLERISIQLVERIFRLALGEDAFTVVRFTAQPPLQGTKKKPDGEIRASCRYLFEVKRAADALSEAQLTTYLQHLNPDGNELLIALTPDTSQPAVIGRIGHPQLKWLSFIRLSDAIDQLIDEDGERMAERDRFLLRELQAHFDEAGLLRLGQDVVIVAASSAYPLYLKHHVYACQPEPERTFRVGVERMGFYADGAIQREVPRVLRREGRFEITDESFARAEGSDDPLLRLLASKFKAMRADAPPGWYPDGVFAQVFLLEAPDSPGTRILERPVVNDLQASSGRGVAYVLGTRYTRADVLTRQPKTTSELVVFERGSK